MKIKNVLLLNMLCCLGLFSGANVSAEEALWQALGQGGKVVLMRHGAVMQGRGQGNSLLRDPSCQQERNLSREGEQQARRIGERFRQHQVPVAEVRYSPFCRTAATAKLAFDSGHEADELGLLEVLPPPQAAAQTAKLKQLIGAYRGDGNLILITHEPNINAVSFETMRHADFLVLQPLGGEEFEELGVITRDAD